jgi:hypothetical protein
VEPARVDRAEHAEQQVAQDAGAHRGVRRRAQVELLARGDRGDQAPFDLGQLGARGEPYRHDPDKDRAGYGKDR